jgi:hypothetical protein
MKVLSFTVTLLLIAVLANAQTPQKVQTAQKAKIPCNLGVNVNANFSKANVYSR